jgi:hypothetical protein
MDDQTPTVIISPRTTPQNEPANPPEEVVIGEAAIDEADDEMDALEEAVHVEAIVCEERHEQLLTALEMQGETLERLNQSINSQQQTDSPVLAQLQAQQTEMLAQLTELSQNIRLSQSPRNRNSSESISPTPSPAESTPLIPPESVPPAVPEKTEAPRGRRVRVV